MLLVALAATLGWPTISLARGTSDELQLAQRDRRDEDRGDDGYYPNVTLCPEGWQAVPVTPAPLPR